MISIRLAAPDGAPLPAARPGQYLTLRIRARATRHARCSATTRSPGRPAPTTTGSASSASTTAPRAATCTRRLARRRPLEVAAPRGTFILDETASARAPDQRRHRRHTGARDAARARRTSTRSGRSGGCTARAAAATTPSRPRPARCSPRSRTRSGHVCYSRPGPDDVQGRDFDDRGPPHGRRSSPQLDAAARRRGVPLRPDSRSWTRSAPGSPALGVDASRIHTEPFGPAPGITPGIASAPARAPHPPAGRARRPARRSSSPAATSPTTGAATTPACSSSPRPATCPSAGRAAPASATPARPPLVSGAVDYDPDPVEPPADGSALICCARPREDVVLDL